MLYMKKKQKKKKQSNMIMKQASISAKENQLDSFKVSGRAGYLEERKKLDNNFLRRELVNFQTMTRDSHDEDAK